MANGFEVKIVAVDHASRTFEAINKRMEALTRPARELQASLQRFSQASGISAIGRRMDDLRSSAFRATEAISRIITPLGALTSAGSIAGLYKLTTTWSAATQQLVFGARRIGIGADSLQNFQNAAQLAGSSAGAVTSGFVHLNDAITDAAQGRNGDVANILNVWAGGAFNADRSIKSVNQVLPQLLAHLRAIKNTANQSALATELFGGAAEELLPVINSSSREWNDYLKQARQLDPFYAGSAQKARQLQLAQSQLGLAVRGVGDAVSVALAPVLTPLLGQLATWISNNRGLLQQKLDEYVKRIGTWIKGIDWKSAEQGLKTFGGKVDHVVQLFGGWKAAADGIAVFMAGSWLSRILSPILTVTTALTKVFLLTNAVMGGAVGKIASGILGRGSALTGAALEAATLPLFGATLGFTLGKTGIGANDTLVRPAAKKETEGQVRAEALRQGVDPDRAVAFMRVESGGNPNALSSAGAIGLFQLMPDTAARLGVNPFDAAQNIRGGIAYIKQLNKQFGGNWDATEAAYNAGPNEAGVRRFVMTGDTSGLPEETQRYVASIDATTATLRPRLPDVTSDPDSDGPGAGYLGSDTTNTRSVSSTTFSDGGVDMGAITRAIRDGFKQAGVTVHLTHENAAPPGFKARVTKAPPAAGRALPLEYAEG